MRKVKRTILIAMLICVVTVPVCSGRSRRGKAKPVRMSILQILDKYAETQGKLKSFIAKGECSTKINTFSDNKSKYQSYSTFDGRVDEKRAYTRTYAWGDINPTMHLTKDKAYYASHLWDGKDYYAYNKAKIKNEFSKGTVFLVQNAEDKQRPRRTSTFEHFPGSIAMGHLRQTVERIDSIIRKADSVRVRDRMEKIRGSDCYVIEAKARTGDYTVWIDPAHGYNIAKAELRKGPGNVLTTGYVLPENDSSFAFVKNVRFKKIGDLWVPIEADVINGRHKLNSRFNNTTSSHYKITEIELNPDHDTLGSFVPDDILNGAKVRLFKGNDRIPGRYTWRDGKVVDALGQVILDSGPAPKQPAAPADAKEVLRRFTESRKNLNSFIVKAHVKTTYTYSGFNGIGVSHSNVEYRYDGNRVKNITSHWGDIGPRDRDIKEENAEYYSNLWDGETAYSFTKSDNHNKGIGQLKMSDKGNPGKYSKEAPESFRKTFFGEVMGYHRGDDVRIGELFLRPSTKLQLREKRSNVRGVDCYVVEADVPEYGKYTVWIDPVHDFHIARIRVQRESGDHVYKQILKEKAIQKELYEVLEFEKKGDAWFPKTCKMKKAHNSVEHQSSWEKEFSFSMITLNPDHDALGSFLPDDIPNGCDVRLLSLPPSKKFVWQNGKVVDKDGREVDVDKLIKAESEKVKKRKPKRK